MTGLLLGVIFAAGVGLVWFGAVVGVQLPPPAQSSRVGALLDKAAVDVAPQMFMAAVVGCGLALALGLVAWWIVEVPAVTVGGRWVVRARRSCGCARAGSAVRASVSGRGLRRSRSSPTRLRRSLRGPRRWRWSPSRGRRRCAASGQRSRHICVALTWIRRLRDCERRKNAWPTRLRCCCVRRLWTSRPVVLRRAARTGRCSLRTP